MSIRVEVTYYGQKTDHMTRCIQVILTCWLSGLLVCVLTSNLVAQKKDREKKAVKSRGTSQSLDANDAKHTTTGLPDPVEDPEFLEYGIYLDTAPRASQTQPVFTRLPIAFQPHERIALIGNTLFDRAKHYGHFEALLHQRFPTHNLVIRNLAWSADAVDSQPRPENFADLEQHLAHEKVDTIIAAFGFNESFAGAQGLSKFRDDLGKFLASLKTKAFNGRTAPKVILVSPIGNENVLGVPAADLNNRQLQLYVQAMDQVAREQQVGFANVFDATLKEMESPGSDLTDNGIHLNEQGYQLFAQTLYRTMFDQPAPPVDETIRQLVVDQNQEYFRRYRPLNTFYYTGGRRKDYGYLDFLPAMKNFDLRVANRDRRLWDLAQGKKTEEKIDDSNLPPLPKTKQSRGANEWLSAADELKAFQIDPRFEVSLFAGEEQFPDIAAPIQMRWDSRGRLWVSCSTTYPHVYPGNKPNDKLVILEDSNADGKADKSSLFADDLHIPLSFELGHGGVYVSEMPDLTFLQDTDGDGKADLRKRMLTGFGTEDSHHALHDFVWTPDGDLLIRESIFHHSQVETPYGPVRQQNSGWFRFEPDSQRLTSFGTYPSTNPWGVTFDDWGQHVASHPIYAEAFHSLDPPYPQQHPKPDGLTAYSGTCGQEFVDFATFPDELRGNFIKVRYKPTNRVEILKWKETDSGYEEEYVRDLIFSTNLSFIPVDISFGPDGALYVCDWYNPVKGHAQYSLRDERRDRHSGRIWRITAKGKSSQAAPRIDGASIPELLEILKRPEYRYRYWAKRELRDRPADEVKQALDKWVQQLDPRDLRYRHHQIEAIWLYRGIRTVNAKLLADLLACEDHHARAAATGQLRYWHTHLPNAIDLLRAAANDTNGIVRMQAAIAATYIGTKPALDAMLDVLKHPREKHLAYAITCALGSHTLRRHWEGNSNYSIEKMLKQTVVDDGLREPSPTAAESQFDQRQGLKVVQVSCVPERMRFTVERITAVTGQPLKIVFVNPDATDHNWLLVKPGSLEEVGIAANNMAKDPKNANSDFIPSEKRQLILQASPMIGPTRNSRIAVMRFTAPEEPGIYPYVCTFPGHWIVMKGELVVGNDQPDVDRMLARNTPTVVRQWTMDDFRNLSIIKNEQTIAGGIRAFEKARCSQCHAFSGHGVNLGPDLVNLTQRFSGEKLLRQLLEPSSEINEKYRAWQFLTTSGKVVSGMIQKETPQSVFVVTNLLAPENTIELAKHEIEIRTPSRVSSMPDGLLHVLTKNEILNLLAFLESDTFRSARAAATAPHAHGK